MQFDSDFAVSHIRSSDLRRSRPSGGEVSMKFCSKKQRIISVAISAMFTQEALASSICDKMGMDEAVLYGAPSGCKTTSCLARVMTDSNNNSYLCLDSSPGSNDCAKGRSWLQWPLNYDLYYKTRSNNTAVNSIVVVQESLTVREEHPRKEPGPVVLSRDHIDFACYEQQKQAYPPERIGPQAVSFNSYDYYHRNGDSSGPELIILKHDFHIKYQNDPNIACKNGLFGDDRVWTNGEERRPLFLLYNRADFSKSVGQIASTRLIPGFDRAFASDEFAESKPVGVAQFRVHMTSYKKLPKESGCIAFLAPTHTVALKQPETRAIELDLALRDLEALQTASLMDLFRPHTWKFPIHDQTDSRF
jgi:hypothetical protein